MGILNMRRLGTGLAMRPGLLPFLAQMLEEEAIPPPPEAPVGNLHLVRTNPHNVRVGQVWKKRDARYAGRTNYERLLRVLSVDGTHARVVNVQTGRRTRILLTDFRDVKHRGMTLETDGS